MTEAWVQSCVGTEAIPVPPSSGTGDRPPARRTDRVVGGHLAIDRKGVVA